MFTLSGHLERPSHSVSLPGTWSSCRPWHWPCFIAVHVVGGDSVCVFCVAPSELLPTPGWLDIHAVQCSWFKTKQNKRSVCVWAALKIKVSFYEWKPAVWLQLHLPACKEESSDFRQETQVACDSADPDHLLHLAQFILIRKLTAYNSTALPLKISSVCPGLDVWPQPISSKSILNHDWKSL